jgi:hypothetical protein
VLLEAGALAMAEGPDGLAEAIALLTEARRLPLSKHDADVMGMLALALDRAGRRGEAASVLAQLSRLGFAASLEARDVQAFDYLSDQADALAMTALVVESVAPKRAVPLWQRFVERAASSLYVEHAREHLTSAPLRVGPPARSPSHPGTP